MSGDAQAAFLFADIAGFTALTEAHGDEHAVQLVEEFASAVQVELPRLDGEHVKSVGDALMLRVPDPADAVQLGLWITRNAMGGHQAPSVRVGCNYGAAVERGGDYFGATINVAARVSALAAGGEVLVTGQMAALVPDLEGVLYESRGRQALRNVAEPVEIFAVVRVDETADHLVVDPVCQMAVDPERAVGRLQVDEKAHYFCSLTCVAAFAQHPERYTN
ncbi:MAG TPA: adenylate/guanylate cyclase domain-containing protein [Gaiellaceae bacterium]|nr:adenylate/guanylate cyclase domain-containing protein [Gaiellaceae bacterium]